MINDQLLGRSNGLQRPDVDHHHSRNERRILHDDNAQGSILYRET